MWEAGKEVVTAIGRAFAVLQSIGVGEEELQPALNASIVFADLGDILERFVVGADQELGGQEVVTEAFDGPDDATGFEVEGGQDRLLSRVMRLMKTMGRTEPLGCSCSRVAPIPSMPALQYKRKGRELSATASQSG